MPVHELTNDPCAAWEVLKEGLCVMRLKIKTPKEPPSTSKVRVVCMSDTHNFTAHIKKSIPQGDIFIHAGDFTKCGHISEVQQFNSWLGSLPHRHKIVIAGNHELTFDPNFTNTKMRDILGPIQHRSAHTGHTGDIQIDQSRSYCLEGPEEINFDFDSSTNDIRGELTNCTYLQDSSISLYGLNIYGTPWQPEFHGWGFNLPRGAACLEKWEAIPSNTDILVTHTPPIGYGDRCATGIRAGCVELLREVQNRIKPKYHIYGHIHEGYGVRTDGNIIFINASTCNISYVPKNPPVVFDITIPDGFSKELDPS